ncbi:MAG TPA: hypothetical protein VNX29_23875 [Kaistia sp.]|nr:hypothetical protein [Kaistia sp.]
MPGTTLRNRIVAACFGTALLVSVSPASAAEPVETAIRSWISALDASPNWVAGFDTLTYDDASRTATLKNLTIRSETLSTKIEVSFGSIAVTGYGDTADGGFTVVALKADDSRVVIGTLSDTKLKAISADSVTVPSFASYAFDPQKMFTSIVKAYAIVAQTSIASLKIDGVDSSQTFEGQTSHATYGGFELANMSKGMVERMSMGPFKQESPSPDGLLTMRADKLEALKVDLNAVVDVFDADRYVGGVGDRKWRTALALETYTNFSMEIPGGQFRVGSVELEKLNLRQPPQSFSSFFDELLANPSMDEAALGKLTAEYLPQMFYAFGIGAFRFTDLDVMAPDVQRFHLGDFHLTDFSNDGLGEFGIGDLDVAADKTSIGAERLAFGGVTFPSLDRISAAVRAGQSGLEADPLSLIPTLGFGEAVNVSVVQDGKAIGALDRGRLDLSDYVGPVPTAIALDLRGINLDLSQVTDPKAREMIAGLGYDRLLADYGFKLNWREADESLSLSDFRLTVKDVGSLVADVMLTGLKRSTIEDPRTLENALPSLLFSRGKVVVKDSSVVDRAVAMQAKKKNQTPEKFREDLAGAMPFTLMLVLKNPGFQAKLAPALQAFIRTPGTMTLTAAPATPVPLLAILAAAQEDPRKLPDLLSVDVKTGD